MPLAPSSPSKSAKMATKLSAWTPLNHPLSNSKVFEERRSLLAKWFDRWSDSQRRAVLRDFVLSCSAEQLRFLSVSVSRRLPLQAADFTCLLPRVLCLYLFSFLDPRSLCRCAQVSWHWKSIVELDQLWMPKCLRLDWYVDFSSTPFQPQGVWKRHYVQTVQELRLGPPQQRFLVPDAAAISSRLQEPSEDVFLGEEGPAPAARWVRSVPGMGRRKEKQPTTPPPWRDSDRRPKDTRRFNYLDNLEPIGQALRAQTRSRVTTCRGDTSEPDNVRTGTPSAANYKLRKAKSLMLLSSNCRPQPPPPPPPPPQSRPHWASCSHDSPVARETAKGLLQLARWNAGIRPGPARAAVPGLSEEALRASRRSHRSAPSTPLQF